MYCCVYITEQKCVFSFIPFLCNLLIPSMKFSQFYLDSLFLITIHLKDDISSGLISSSYLLSQLSSEQIPLSTLLKNYKPKASKLVSNATTCNFVLVQIVSPSNGSKIQCSVKLLHYQNTRFQYTRNYYFSKGWYLSLCEAKGKW